ncbi:uncharacterized protein LOC135848202 [Planococcus citri]|uniref:uncharacterized protein LOC135848202 n=1 Tax=Planococcus citri TaxID=170843 RepID=UPI0031F97462
MDLKRPKNELYDDEIEFHETSADDDSCSETSDEEPSTSKIRDDSSKSIFNHRKSTGETPSKRPKISKTKSAGGSSGTKNIKNNDGDKLKVENISANNLKILIPFLRHIPEEYYSIAFATDTDTAGNSDDIVFRYKEPNGKLVYRFLQIEQKKHANKEITLDDLLGEMDQQFSLKKHFHSFRKAIKNPLFKGYEMKDFVICTNADMALDLKSNFAKISGSDNLLSFGKRTTDLECLKLKFDDVSKKNKFTSALKKISKCNRLAEKLANCVHNRKVISFKNNLLADYHRAIRKYIIEPEDFREGQQKIINVKFRTDFLNGNLPEQVKNFRKAFYEAYIDLSKKQIPEHQFWANMKNARPKMHQSYRTYLELDDDPKLNDYRKLAEEIAAEMKYAHRNDVKIERRTQVIKDNIDKLAGYVFIKKNNSMKDTYYFSSKFVRSECKLPRDIEKFRNHLKDVLLMNKVAFNEKKYKFYIKNFVTCLEAVVYSESYLPYINDADEVSEKEINYFFEKLVFAINQPNGTEMDKYFNFSHDNAGAYSPLHEYISSWIKTKKGCFQDHLEGKAFIREINTRISKLEVRDSTVEYCAELASFGIEFMDNLSVIRSFLNSKEERILNLVSSPQTCQSNLIKRLQTSINIRGNKSDTSIATKLSAIKVMQTLKNIPEYEGSFIFMPTRSILPVHDIIMNNFDSIASINLLVIECGDEETNIWKLYQRLCSTIERHADKKIIIITQKDYILTKAFQDYFSGTMKYKQIDDEKSRAIVDKKLS